MRAGDFFKVLDFVNGIVMEAGFTEVFSMLALTEVDISFVFGLDYLGLADLANSNFFYF